MNIFQEDSKTVVLPENFAAGEDRSGDTRPTAIQPPFQTREEEKLVVRNYLIEESMDSLDFFKVTNLGRINNDQANKTRANPEPEKRRKEWTRAGQGSVQRPRPEESKQE